ncbi:MAG: PepSY domain-containing protein [Rhodospirillales bacterium]|nr:PepSY domain-containing protein [Rhodospirillales bacterium]MDH3791517.1 PepSY domain-containing protein [Rhodospirillales bacterium]MDH3920640.1 PepSY domain-containing protein [Rhodospirillales bacterium]
MNGKPRAKGRVLRACRSVHGWLGALVLPWVIVIGATGLYLNHSKAVLPLFGPQAFSESGFEAERPAAPITRERARALAESVWPEDPIRKISEKDYHGRPSFYVEKRRGKVILSIPTGHYYLKTRYTRRTFSPQGQLLHSKTYWGTIFKDLHRSGWLGWGLGTWPADLVSIAMVVFGLTGSMMWWVPRTRRFLRKRQAPGNGR